MYWQGNWLLSSTSVLIHTLKATTSCCCRKSSTKDKNFRSQIEKNWEKKRKKTIRHLPVLIPGWKAGSTPAPAAAAGHQLPPKMTHFVSPLKTRPCLAHSLRLIQLIKTAEKYSWEIQLRNTTSSNEDSLCCRPPCCLARQHSLDHLFDKSDSVLQH